MRLILALLLFCSAQSNAAQYNQYTVMLLKYPSFTVDPVSGYNPSTVGTVPSTGTTCGSGGMQGVFSDSNYYTLNTGAVVKLTSTAINYWSIEADIYITGIMAFPSMLFWGGNDSQLDATGTHLRWSSSGGTLVGSATLAQNTCYHVTYLCNGNASKTLFVGSSVDATMASDGRFGAATQINIGKNGGAGGFSFASGYIDNYRLNIYPDSATAAAATFPTIDPPTNPVRSVILEQFMFPTINGGAR